MMKELTPTPHPASLAAVRAQRKIESLNRLLATKDFGPDHVAATAPIRAEIERLRAALAAGKEAAAHG